MTKTEDPFNPENLRLDLSGPAIAPKPGAPKPERKAKWKRHFTRFPYEWQVRLRDCRAGSTYQLALYLLYEHWRSGGHRIRLSNGVLAKEGVSRKAKRIGLVYLERVGLVEIERRPRKAPLIKCLLIEDMALKGT